MNTPTHDGGVAPETPATCPFCSSPKVKIPIDKVDANTYWRCEACGEMWNVSRLRQSGRRPYNHR